MENNIRFSIITVVYNAVKTIEQTIQSVISQDYNDIEYIIIDGASTDGTVDIIKKYADKISYWVSEPDRGIYDAMNKGILQTTGDYIYFIGSDDCLFDYKIISRAGLYLCKDSTIDVLSGQVWMVDAEYNIQQLYSNQFTIDDVYNGYCIQHQGLFVRSFIMKQKLFDISYKISADYNLFLQLFFDKSIKFKYINEKIAFYALEGISSDVSGNGNLCILENMKAMKDNHINEVYIKAYEKKMSNILHEKVGFKYILRYFFSRVGILKYIRMHRGWEKHFCNWEICRWCKRG